MIFNNVIFQLSGGRTALYEKLVFRKLSQVIVRIHASRVDKTDAIEKLISLGANVEAKDK